MSMFDKTSYYHVVYTTKTKDGRNFTGTMDVTVPDGGMFNKERFIKDILESNKTKDVKEYGLDEDIVFIMNCLKFNSKKDIPESNQTKDMKEYGLDEDTVLIMNWLKFNSKKDFERFNYKE